MTGGPEKFSKGRGPSGRKTECRECDSRRSHAYRAANRETILRKGRDRAREKREKDREKYNANTRAYRAANPTGSRVYVARARAKTKGIPARISPKDVPQPDKCPVFGTPFVHKDSRLQPEIDKIRPADGYVPGNVLTVSGRANRLKSDGTPEELFRVAVYAYFAERLAGGDPHERQVQVTALVEQVFSGNQTLEDYLLGPRART